MVGLLFFRPLSLSSPYFLPTVKPIQFRLIPPFTAAYNDMIALRMKVLLAPIGIPRSYINPQKEAGDMLIGAYQDNTLAGCCILTPVDDAAVQLRQMAVDTTAQQTGIGRQIVLFAEQAAREKGFTRLMMHARDAVIPFYQKCGYAISGDRFFEVGIPHHRMEKNLLGEAF